MWFWKRVPPTQTEANGDGLWGGMGAVVTSLPCGDNDVPLLWQVHPWQKCGDSQS